MPKKIKVVDVTPNEPVQETVEEAVEEPVEEAVEEEPPPPPPPPPKTKIAKAKTIPAPVVESETEEEEVAPPPKKKKIPKAKSEPIVKVTTLIPCQKCGKRMTAKSLKYSHVCGNVAAKAAPKPKPKPKPKPQAEDGNPTSAHIRTDEPTTYHDLIKQRVMQQREQREHHIKNLFSRAV